MRLLVWGLMDGPVPYFRGSQFGKFWPGLGVDAVFCTLAAFNPTFVDGAEVVLFRRWYVDQGQTETAWDRCGARGIARVYDSDDWDFGMRPDNPNWANASGQFPLIAKMAREADLVTTSTPYLAGLFSRYNPRVRVLRNAVDPSLYAATEPRTDERVTSVYYGSRTRLREYFGTEVDGHWRGGYADAAVRAAGLRAVWIGDDGRGPIPREFDDVIAYDHDFVRFCRQLGNAHGDIGPAPLIGDSFDLSKSELHWLELTAAGVAVVAQRLAGGPYSVIRDGTDGILARGAREWHDAVRRLAAEPALRADLVAAARERLATDYDPRRRAGEWADAFREAQG